MAQDLPDHEITDLSVFEKPINEDEEAACKKGDYQCCAALHRIAAGLRYYSVLNILYNASHLEVFNNFIGELYSTQQFVNDYIHLMQQHEKDSKDIETYLIETTKLFKPCNVKTCKFTARHQSADGDQDDYAEDEQDEQENQPTRKQRKRNSFDPMTAFYKQTFDALHFHLFHLFDSGLRIEKVSKETEEEKEKEKANDEYYDAALARINEIILARKHITNSFGRFRSNQKTNKFDVEHAQTEQKNDQTYLDSVYKRLKEMKIDSELIERLRAFLESEEYDSEAVAEDVSDRNSAGNISVTATESIVPYLRSTTASKAFAIGYRFYYWDWFKHQTQLDAQKEASANHVEHGGYTVCDMYVERKYGSFKQELLEYGFEFNVKLYNERILVKANALLLSKMAKTLKAAWYGNYEGGSLPHYGVSKNDALRFSNIVAVILYTDYSALCAAFSSTFRKKDVFETLEETKKRNSRYWWWAKTLRETVELYGSEWYRGKLRGPFYCGMSALLKMPQFLIRLNGPTSTSFYQEVAKNFCREKGIIVQLNNNTGAPHCILRGLKCSWISRYSSEAECLFFGGYWALKIEAVFVMETNRNLETVMATLHALDRIINGQLDKKDEKRNGQLLSALFSFYVGNDTKVQLDEYVAATFGHYVESKSEIHLDLGFLSGDASYVGIKELLMNEKTEKKSMEDVDVDVDLSACALEGDETNLFKPALFQIFKNVTDLTIKTTWGTAFYPFSFLSLLRLIEGTLLTKVVIKAEVNENIAKSWLDMLLDKDGKYATERELIIKAYNDAKYHVQIEPVATKGYRHCVITKQ